ncbi:MAG: hypothetical protein ABF654_12320, partial [Gluconobacter potus]|uniref:hypothetical protein n=1 Tax=Gluconobacter potus TaxID=2724927 RepID=UPI0039EA9218
TRMLEKASGRLGRISGDGGWGEGASDIRGVFNPIGNEYSTCYIDEPHEKPGYRENVMDPTGIHVRNVLFRRE